MWLSRRINLARGLRSDEFGSGAPKRTLVDVLLCVAVVALAAIFIDAKVRDDARAQAIETTRDSLRSLEREIGMRALLAGSAGDAVVHPTAIDPAWFGDVAIQNALLDSNRPWIEFATEFERGLRHPRSPIASGREAAMFWYNPSNGVVRARVPETLSDAAAIALYNRVNRTKLRELRTVATVEDRDSGQ